MPPTCTGPGPNGTRCTRPAVAFELCRAHYDWQRRHPGKPLHPIRTGPGRPKITLRVSPECRERVLADPPGARAVLEAWASAYARGVREGERHG